MALRTAGSVLVAFLWSVAVVLGQNGWSVTYTTESICALKGSKVELTCSFSYPRRHKVTSTFWFTKMETGVEPEDLGVQDQNCNRVTYTKRRICVLKGSTVDISCTYIGYYSTTSTFWFRSDKSTPEDLTRDPGYTGRVKYTGTNEDPFTLRISGLREEDSAEYHFTFKTHNFEWGHSFPGTTLTVTGLQVKVTPAAEGQKTLTCSTTCTLTDNPTYIWYKNGQRLDEPTSQQYSSNMLVVWDSSVNIYSCAVEGQEGLHSPVVCFQVKVTPQQFSEYKTLTCSTTCILTDNPTYIWYKNGQRLDEPTSQQHSSNTLVVLGHSVDNYSCTVEHHEDFHSPAVYAPKNTSVSVSPSGEIVEGSSVTLTCSSDANPPVDKYTWYKKNVASTKASGQSYSITNISSEDRGEYYCEAQNGRGSMNSTALMIIVAVKQTSVMTAAVGIIVLVLVLILCLSGLMWFRRSTGGSDATADTQSVHPDCNSDTYTALNMRTMSPDYDTLASVHPDPNSDTYTPLNMKTRSPEYDTLANVRGLSH
ncbi:B-cell receptor CD22-like [Salmo trutta]|uniref:B-cell receptor CD22-like n=1 Tax=Salmo trutta TaxID=8032 RepID=UPI0011325C66|nr:B-cell receptor CD22-like [Salmo trutta]